MIFDKDNRIVQLCAEGMNFEGEGNKGQALKLFMQAWSESTNDLEKFIASHYVARQQNTIEDKLHWDKTALVYANKIDDDEIKGSFPSLYLNIGKCYEDLGDFSNARVNYLFAMDFIEFLPKDGYGNMIKSGIKSGIQRVSQKI